MSDGVVIAIITSSTSLLLAVVNAVIAWVQRRAQKKSGMETRIENIEADVKTLRTNVEADVKKLTEHSELQYLSLLRLTVMDSDMPMSERLIAGREYISRGGNGDVKAAFEALEKKVNA